MTAESVAALPPLRARRLLAESWDVYRRELLAAIPAVFATRVSVVLATTALVELPVVLGHLVLSEAALDVASDSVDVYLAPLLTAIWAGLGHHLLVGVLERVVGAERAGHERPTLRATLSGLPWGRLVVADVVLTVVTVVGMLLLVVPGLVLATYLTCVMPLLSMRHEHLGSAWGASVRLVRGSFWPVAVAVTVAWLVQTVALGAMARLVHLVTDSHTWEVVAHGAAALVVLPFSALVPVIITFDLLERRSVTPQARW